MRCPGAVTPSRRLTRGSVRPRPASSPEERICAGAAARLRCLGPKTGWQPACRRSDGAASADHLPPPTKTWRSRNLVCRQGRENGESWGGGEGRERGRRWSSVLRWAPKNRPLDVLVLVSRQRDTRPPHLAMFAINGRQPCAMRKGERSSISASRRESSGLLAPSQDEVGRVLELPQYRPPQWPTGFPTPRSANWPNRRCRRSAFPTYRGERPRPTGSRASTATVGFRPLNHPSGFD
jgi:hypothetical protein